MKRLLRILLVFVLSAAFAGEYDPPIHTPNRIVEAVTAAGLLKSNDVKIVSLSFNYVRQEWYVGLGPLEEPTKENGYQVCTDCYPTIYIQNKEPLTVQVIPHG